MKSTTPPQKNGFSLIEVMVALLISGAIALAVASFVVNNQRELTALENTQLKIDYALEINQALQSYSACGWQMAAASTILPIDVSTITPANPGNLPISAAKLYAGADPTTSAVIFESGTDISLLMKRYKAGAISLKNIRPGSNALNYIGSLVFDLIPNGSHRPLTPIAIPISFNVKSTDPINAKTITDCCTGNKCALNAAASTVTTVNIFCYDASGFGHTCVKNVRAALNLDALGVNASSIKLVSCAVDANNSYHAGSSGPYTNTLNYNQATSDLSLTVKKAGVSVDIIIDYSAGATSGLTSPFSCP